MDTVHLVATCVTYGKLGIESLKYVSEPFELPDGYIGYMWNLNHDRFPFRFYCSIYSNNDKIELINRYRILSNGLSRNSRNSISIIF